MEANNQSKQQIGIEVLYTPYFINEDFREIIARCSNLSPELILILSMDKDYIVRRHMAKHPSLTTESIDRLTRDHNWSVRYTIAHRDDLTEEQVERLSKDEDGGVRRVIADNPHAQKILKK